MAAPTIDETVRKAKLAACKREWYQRHKDRIRENGTIYRAQKREEIALRKQKYFIENVLEIRRRDRERWAKNRELRCAQLREGYARNADERRRKQRLWNKKNPEKLQEGRHRRRLRIEQTDSAFSAQDVRDIYKMQRGRCAICRIGLRKRYHLDHIQPISKGGSNSRRNIQLACESCNRAKRAMDPIEFMRRVGRLI